MRTIDEIIIHCTGSSQSFTLADLRTYHLSRGFSDIGYHYVIFPDGEIKLGRSLFDIGAHCSGHNSHSIGVAWVGGLNGARNMTPQQEFSLIILVIELVFHTKLPIKFVSTHNFYNHGKSCPNYKFSDLHFPQWLSSYVKFQD